MKSDSDLGVQAGGRGRETRWKGSACLCSVDAPAGASMVSAAQSLLRPGPQGQCPPLETCRLFQEQDFLRGLGRRPEVPDALFTKEGPEL